MSDDVIARLLALPEVKSARTILLYYSLDDEVFTHGAVDELLAEGKEVLLPVVVSDSEMEIRRYNGPEDLRRGSLNIMEPVGTPFTDYQSIDVVVVPGMAFDADGNRLGRGKGYYDRFLALVPDAYKIGVCFPFQKFPAVPVDDNDVKMDIII